MSVTFGTLVQPKSDRIAVLTWSGMLVAALLIVALTISFGVSPTEPTTIVVGP
jgi:hypothetical protein